MSVPTCECGQPARMDPLGYWMCFTPGCAQERRVLRYGTDSERERACARPRCGRLDIDPVHDPRNGPVCYYQPRDSSRQQ